MSEAQLPAPDRAEFGRRLAKLRRAAGLTQEQLGKRMRPDGGDLTKASVSGWEVGASSPNADQLALICQRLSCSADELLGLSEKEGI